MRTTKILALYELIDWVNEIRCTERGEAKIPQLPKNSELLHQNAWLSGFIEAEGHFSIRTSYSKKSPFHKVECKFELVQAQIPINRSNIGVKHCNLAIMSEIADFLQCSLKEVKTSSKCPQYRIRTQNVSSNILLEGYLKTFPLFGKKRLDYLDWLKVFALFKNGRYNHKDGIEGAKQIKEGMNDRRTYFVWDHLQNFYHLEK